MQMEGTLLKMQTSLENDLAKYSFVLGEESVELNSFIGRDLCLEFTGEIHCIATGERISKTYGQGYSFKSFSTLAQCDLCMVKPETCHFHKGTCREPDWGEANCMIDHVVYLANSSALKVGITRERNIPHRWIDQGATQALPIARVKNRLTAGLVESELSKSLNDKTNWREMLKGKADDLNLRQIANEIWDEHHGLFGESGAERPDAAVVSIDYPVLDYPKKIKSLNFDKDPVIEGTLQGIKAQYLIFDSGVINIRKFQGYNVALFS